MGISDLHLSVANGQRGWKVLPDGGFIDQLGANSTNLTFISALYQNVLGRAPDQVGFNNWNNELEASIQDRGDVLFGFSESVENIALVGPTIEDGIWLG